MLEGDSRTDVFFNTYEPELAAVGRVERLLLLLTGIFVAVNYLALLLIRSQVLSRAWLPFAAWAACILLGHLTLNRFLPRRDPLLFPVAMFLNGWGLVTIDRLLPAFADRQALWLCIAVVMMVVVAALRQPIRWLREYRYLLLIAGLGLLLATIVFGRNPTGQLSAPQLWLGVGGVFFQPSEALKIMLVAFLASYLAEQFSTLEDDSLGRWQRGYSISPRILGPVLLMWGVSLLVLVWQRDLGTAILFFAIFLILMYVATGNSLILISGAILILVAGMVAYFLFAVVQLRVDIWLFPWAEADGRAYQIVQSLMAFASGGVFGQGIAQGTPVFIPVIHSDFIFAAIGEEWGLLGVIAVVVCFMVIAMRGLRIGLLRQDRPFYALLAVGLTTLIVVQGLLIMGGVLKIVPLTGVTLPFVSYGGSSLLMSFIIIGMLLRLSSGKS